MNGEDQHQGTGEPAGVGPAGRVDARGATGVMVGDQNTQILYTYNQLTWTDGVAPPPLTAVSGRVDSPYRGLAAFDERDAPFFFGRERATTEVLNRMSRHWATGGVMVVSGVSGAGKSSLLRAGVLPRLRGAGLPDAPRSAQWPCLIFTPSDRPLAELALHMATLGGPNAAQTLRELTIDPQGLALLARQAARQPWLDDDVPEEVRRAARVVLFVDQFEQLFTLCPDEAQRRAFVTALAAAASGRDAGAVVVIGVRADFEARCADYLELAEAVQERFLVTSMTEPQLRAAITGPAHAIGAEVEPALVDVLVGEAQLRRPAPGGSSTGAVSGAGVLPLVSHALDQAWRSRVGATLTLSDYERTGGIEGAVAASAQRAYDGLTEAQQAQAQRLFVRLTVTGADGRDTAGRMATADLLRDLDPAQQADLRTVVEAFVAERLVTLAAGTVEISHEALLTAWPLLRDVWLAETRADRAVRTRLDNAVGEWQAHDRDASYLYAGTLLDTANESVRRTALDPHRFSPLSGPAAEFLEASTRAARRRTRRRRASVAALLVLVLALASASLVALRAQRVAGQQRDAARAAATVATGRELAARALNEIPTDIRQAMADAVQGYRTYPGTETRRTLWEVATANPHLVRLVDVGATVTSMSAPADGSAIAVGDKSGNVTVLRPDGTVVRSRHLFSGPVTGVAVSQDGATVVATDSHGVSAWSGDRVTSLRDRQKQEVLTVAVSEDGAHQAYVTSAAAFNSVLTLLDTGSGRRHTTTLTGLVRLCVIHRGQVITLDTAYGSWDRLDLTLSRVLAHGQPGFGAHNYAQALAPDGSTFSYTNSAPDIPVWTTTDSAATYPPPLNGRGPGVSPGHLALSPGGRAMAVEDSGVLYLSAIGKGTSQRAYRAVLDGLSDQGVTAVAFLGGDTRLAAGTGTRVALWDLDQFQRIAVRQPADVTAGCVACGGPDVSPSSGDRVAYISDGFVGLVIHDLADGSELTGSTGYTFGPQLWKGSDTLVQGYPDGSIRLLDAATGQARDTWQPVSSRGLVYLRWVDSGRRLASVDDHGVLTLRDATTGRNVETVSPPPSIRPLSLYGFGDVGVDSRGAHVAYSTSGKVSVLDTGSGQVTTIHRTTYSQDRVRYAAGDRLVVTRFDSMDSFDDAGASLVRHLSLGKMLEPPVPDPSFSRIAYQEQDGRIVVEDLASGQQIADLTVPASIEGRKSGFAFSPDGTELVVVTEGVHDSGQIQRWEISTPDLISSLCTASGSCRVDGSG